MSPEKQRIAIAEACGWQGIFIPDHCEWPEATPPGEPMLVITVPIPDFTNDLNAMREVVVGLPRYVSGETFRGTQECFHDELQAACRHADGSASYFEVINATAAQRAEAFLRTLNLWTE